MLKLHGVITENQYKQMTQGTNILLFFYMFITEYVIFINLQNHLTFYIFFVTLG